MPKFVGPSGVDATGVQIKTSLPYIIVNGSKVWIQATDPAGSAANGDVWIDTVP